MDLIRRDYGDSHALELWEELKRKIPRMFEGIEVRPSLVHGDLWSGNAAQAEGKAGECGTGTTLVPLLKRSSFLVQLYLILAASMVTTSTTWALRGCLE